MFRVPVELAWLPEVSVLQASGLQTSHVELVHAGLRYAVVWPSMHPEGRRYRWFGPDGQRMQDLPRLEDVAALPSWWIKVLARSKEPSVGPRRPGQDQQVTCNAPPVSQDVGAVLSRLTSAAGTRNEALNRAAYTLGRCSDLDEAATKDRLLKKALSIGLTQQEAVRTINSGFAAGRRAPT